MPLSNHGKPSVAAIKEMIITAAARKIARSREGNASPLGRASGSVITPANVTAPRTPPNDSANMMRGVARASGGGVIPRMIRASQTEPKMHAKRKTASMSQTINAYASSDPASWPPICITSWAAALKIPGNCSPSSTNMIPLSVNCIMSQTIWRCMRANALTRPDNSARLTVQPAATAAKMPEAPICSARKYAAKGIKRLNRTSERGSAPKRLVKPSRSNVMAEVTSAPVARPAPATQRNEMAADDRENAPVIAAATARRNATNPLASLNSASPSRIAVIRRGMASRCVMPATATGSVGEMMAASAYATANGIEGIIQ
ncbi:hypothetical protein AK36_2459 [Burkholderia vietnamiensis LMG 10929]|nr:hypothetical protein AK36_2459 [Burkholderia vietnamiensis LMG 10929]